MESFYCGHTPAHDIKAPELNNKMPGKKAVDMANLKQFIAPVFLGVALAVAPMKDLFAQKTDPISNGNASYAKNEGKLNNKFTPASNNSVDYKNDSTKNKVPPLSVEEQAAQYSEGGKGMGIVIKLGKIDSNVKDSTMENRFARLFTRAGITGKVFIERSTEYDGSAYKPYLNGSSVYGTMTPAEFKEKLPKIISTQQGFEARNTALNSQQSFDKN